MIPESLLDDFSVILREVREMFPGSSPVIGGGALRDAFHRRPIKDVDVLLRAKDHATLDHPDTKILIPEFVSEYCGRPDLHGVWNVNRPIAGYEVQLILADFEGPQDLAGTFDLGICRVTYDGDEVFYHEDFIADSQHKCFRICRNDNEYEVSRSLRRIKRIRQKYPEFSVVEPEVNWSFKVIPAKCPTCSGTVTGFRNQISLKEYGISRMCQACQDSVFGED